METILIGLYRFKVSYLLGECMANAWHFPIWGSQAWPYFGTAVGFLCVQHCTSNEQANAGIPNSVCIYIYMYMHIHTHIYIYRCVCICIRICMYIYTHVYMVVCCKASDQAGALFQCSFSQCGMFWRLLNASQALSTAGMTQTLERIRMFDPL